MKSYGYNYKHHKKFMQSKRGREICYGCDCWLCWPEKKTTKSANRHKAKLEIKRSYRSMDKDT